MRFLVTGGTGFVGSHVVDALLARGDDVTALVRDPKKVRWLDGKDVEKAVGDVAEGSGLDAALEGCEAVIHIAGVIKARTEDEYRRGNAGGVRNVLGAMAKSKRDFQSVVVLTSLAAVGPPADGVAARDMDPCAPVSAYGRSKAEAEAACAEFKSLPVIVGRPSIVYGPRDEAVLEIFRIVKRHLKPHVAPEQRLSMIHVRDLARGILAAAERGRPGERFFLAHEEILTSRELTDRVEQALGVTALPLTIPQALLNAAANLFPMFTRGRSMLNRDKAREMTQKAWVCDVSRTGERLRWKAGIPHTDGLFETARWYRALKWL